MNLAANTIAVSSDSSEKTMRRSTWGRFIPLSNDHPALKSVELTKSANNLNEIPSIYNNNSNQSIASSYENLNNRPSSSILNVPKFKSKTENNDSELHNNEFLTELPLSLKIDLQKDIVNMLEIMKNEYLIKLGPNNELTKKSIEHYNREKTVLDTYNQYF